MNTQSKRPRNMRCDWCKFFEPANAQQGWCKAGRPMPKTVQGHHPLQANKVLQMASYSFPLMPIVEYCHDWEGNRKQHVFEAPPTIQQVGKNAKLN